MDELELERYRSYLVLLARMEIGRQIQPKLDASDVVQQTLLEAHQKRAQFAGRTPGQFAAWLRKLLACTLADAIRTLHRAKRDVARERSLEASLDQSAASLNAWLAADQSTPSQQFDRGEQELQLADALSKLPEAQRTALVLRHCHSLSVADISVRMGRSPTAVAGLIKRGARQLRELMAEKDAES